MVAPLFTISSTMGTLFGIKAFAVAILGGIGSAWGVVLAGLIYGVGAFAAVFMVDHGGSAHFVFLTIAVAYAALFVGFLVNARLGERIERREVLFFAGILFAVAWSVAWLVPNLWSIAGC